MVPRANEHEVERDACYLEKRREKKKEVSNSTGNRSAFNPGK